MSDPHEATSTTYARRLYDDTATWARSADGKAEVLLTLNGVFLSFLSALVIGNPENLETVLDSFGPETWAFLATMSICIAISIIFALKCLWSRTSPGESLQRLRNDGVRIERPETYTAGVMGFMGEIQHLSEKHFSERLKDIGPDFEREALAIQIHRLSQKVAQQHHNVNLGFGFAGGALIALALTLASYAVRTAI